MPTLLLYIYFCVFTVFLLSIYVKVREINKNNRVINEFEDIDYLIIFIACEKDNPPENVIEFINYISSIYKQDIYVVYMLICNIEDSSVKYNIIEEFKYNLIKNTTYRSHVDIYVFCI